MNVDGERVHGSDLDGPSSHHPGMLFQDIVFNVQPGTLANEMTMYTPICKTNCKYVTTDKL